MNYGEYKQKLADICQDYLHGLLTPNEMFKQIRHCKGVYEGWMDKDGTEWNVDQIGRRISVKSSK